MVLESEPVADRIQLARDVLRRCVKATSLRELDRRLGRSPNYVARVLRGEIIEREDREPAPKPGKGRRSSVPTSGKSKEAGGGIGPEPEPAG